MLDGPGGTGCNVPFRSCWDSRDVIVAQTKPHTTPNMKNTHPQVFTNLNVMTVPNTILVKQVHPSKHDILNM